MHCTHRPPLSSDQLLEVSKEDLKNFKELILRLHFFLHDLLLIHSNYYFTLHHLFVQIHRNSSQNQHCIFTFSKEIEVH